VHVDYQYRYQLYEQRLEQAAVDNAAEHVRVTEAWEKQVTDTKEVNKQARIHAKDEHEARAQAAVDRDAEIEATKEANEALWKRQLAAFSAECERVANDNRTRVFAGAAVFASQVGAVLARQQQMLDAHRQAYQYECGGTLEENAQTLQAAKAQHQQSVQRVRELNAAAEAQAHGEWERAYAAVAEYNAPRLAQLSVEADVLRAQEDVAAFAASLAKYEKYLKEHGRTYNANAQVNPDLYPHPHISPRRACVAKAKRQRCFEGARDGRTTPDTDARRLRGG
jgi:hypothetical protein